MIFADGIAKNIRNNDNKKLDEVVNYGMNVYEFGWKCV